MTKVNAKPDRTNTATIGFEAKLWLAALRDTLLPKLLSGKVERRSARIRSGGDAMNRRYPAPTGRKVIAQGNALAAIAQRNSRPEGAEQSRAESHWPDTPARFRPFRASEKWGSGVPRAALRFALGYHRSPRWGLVCVQRTKNILKT